MRRGRNDREHCTEKKEEEEERCHYATLLWPLDAKSQLIGKDLDAGKD